MAEPTKQETDQVFKVLKAQKANKVRAQAFHIRNNLLTKRHTSHVLTAPHEIRPGQASLSVSTSVSIVQAYTETWACISVSSGKKEKT